MHHAYLLVGDSRAAGEFLRAFCEERGIKLAGSPDYFPYTESLFGIEEARKLTLQASKKAFIKEKVFFITPEKITSEAQNALLKTFEDPYENTHFFLVIRDEELVLPTLRSRMFSIKLTNKASEASEAQTFLKQGTKDRLAFVKKFVDKEKNLSIFLDELMLVLKEGKRFDALKRVYEVRRYSDDRSTSPRLILEHLSVVL